MGVCSRNLDIKKDLTNKFWKAVVDAKIDEKIKTLGRDVVFQGELLGEGVQGNKYGIIGNKIMFFNIWDIKKQRYYDYNDMVCVFNDLGLITVPILNTGYTLTDSIPELVEMSKGYSLLSVKPVLREGIVIRPIDEVYDFTTHAKLVGGRVSFKSVNPEFLLKYGE